MKLNPVAQRFVLHWGKMGSKWGVNRTVAQTHALLYLAGKPLHAEEIVETLAVARSNVSNSLKELQSWNLIKVIHVLGDTHIYLNHLDAVKEQLSREPYPLPQLQIRDRGQLEIDEFEMDDFELVNYQHHPSIRAEMAV